MRRSRQKVEDRDQGSFQGKRNFFVDCQRRCGENDGNVFVKIHFRGCLKKCLHFGFGFGRNFGIGIGEKDGDVFVEINFRICLKHRCTRLNTGGWGGGCYHKFLLKPLVGGQGFQDKIAKGVPYFGFYCIYIKRFLKICQGVLFLFLDSIMLVRDG